MHPASIWASAGIGFRFAIVSWCSTPQTLKVGVYTSARSLKFDYDFVNQILSDFQALLIVGADGAPDPRLLKLYASDKHDGRHGLYAQLALDACGIITGNRWDGWLSRFKDRAGDKEDPSSILQEPSYYFHLPDTTEGVPYAIVPGFADWRFPHGRDGAQLPTGWQQLGIDDGLDVQFARSHFSSAVRYRDKTCRMSGRRASTQIAHLCPVKEFEWIRQNSMHQYNRLGEPGSEDISNLLLLRADLHIEFDKNLFVFVPKRKTGNAPSERGPDELVIHMLRAEEELEFEYHNRTLQPWAGAGPGKEWLFTRFAWSIFPFLSGFLADKVPRRLQVRSEDGTVTDEIFSIECCMAFSVRARGTKSRSQSPQKRSRPSEPDISEPDGNRSPISTEDIGERVARDRKRKGCDDGQISGRYTEWHAGTGNSPKGKRRCGTWSSCSSESSTGLRGEKSLRSSQNEVARCWSSEHTEIREDSTASVEWEKLSRMKEENLLKQRESAPGEAVRDWQKQVDWARKVSREEAVLTGEEVERWCAVMQG